MAAAVIMPKAGITVEQCIMGKWEKKIGDKIAIGDILFSYETDKATFECESTAAGELLATFYNEGDEVPVLVNVCAVGEKGEDVSALRPDGAASIPTVAEASAPQVAASTIKFESGPVITVPTVRDASSASAVDPIANRAGELATGELKISPRARNLAERSGADASLATPTGPYGRVIERDIRTLMASGITQNATAASKDDAVPATAASAVVSTSSAASGVGYTDVKFSGIRRSIAKAMHNSISSMAQLTHHHTFDASEIMDYRKKIKNVGGDLGGVTLTDMILYAVSRTLISHPDLNANMIDDTTLRHFEHVHLGLAVDTPRGLMVPTIFNADQKSLLEISKEAKELAAQARSGSISPDFLKGGTFTISNLGSLGVEMFTPVVNPPQTGILGVCSIVNRVRDDNGTMKLYPAMGLSLTYDHRAVDGAPAARFASELVKNLESFTVLLAK